MDVLVVAMVALIVVQVAQAAVDAVDVADVGRLVVQHVVQIVPMVVRRDVMLVV